MSLSLSHTTYIFLWSTDKIYIPNHVSYGVIFLVDGKNCSIWNLGVLFSSNLLLSLKQQEWLKSWRSIHLVTGLGIGYHNSTLSVELLRGVQIFFFCSLQIFKNFFFYQNFGAKFLLDIQFRREFTIDHTCCYWIFCLLASIS